MRFVKGFAGFCGVLLINISLIIATLSFLGYLNFKQVIFGSIFLLISGIVEVSISEVERGDYEDSKEESNKEGGDAK